MNVCTVDDSDDLIEVAIPGDYLPPDSISDSGQVQQGGLHAMIPWIIGRIFGA